MGPEPRPRRGLHHAVDEGRAHPVPSVGGLDRDSQGCIWFSEQFANKIGRLCIEGISAVNASQLPSADGAAASQKP